MKDMNINIQVNLDWPSYEDDINEVIKQTILEDVRKEVKKQTEHLRAAIAKQLLSKQKELIDRAIKTIADQT